MSSATYTFSSFTFDSTSGVLKRNGKRLKIPPQESSLLSLLLERAGSVVSRDEIQKLLWPDGELIDHDHAINTAINHLRVVFRDSSQRAKYIETYPKRGYCFKEEVVREWKEAPLGNEDAPVPVPVLREAVTESIPSESEPFVPVAVGGDGALLAESPILVNDDRPHAPWSFHSLASSPSRWVVISGISLVLIVALATVFKGREEAHSRAVSLGIAPFETQGTGADSLGDAFRLDLLDSLSELPTVQVRASHSLDHLPHDDAGIREISSKMHLDLLLLGKLTLQGNNCVLQFELVRGRDALHLASIQYSGSKDELATIRDKVRRDVYSRLKLTGKPLQVVRGSTQDSLAYEYYLRGREYAYQRTQESLSRALQQYSLALGRDPNFARAYAGMATAHLANLSYSNSNEEPNRARLSAERAIQLDPDVAEAHAVLAYTAFYQDWNFSQGERELHYALELDPHQAVYHAWLAKMLAIEGRLDEALREIEFAHADDPLWPQVYNIEIPVAAAARDYARALEAAHKYQSSSLDSPFTHDQIAWTLFGMRRYEEAIAEWRKMAVMEHDTDRIAFEDRGLKTLTQSGVGAYAALHLEAAVHLPNAPLVIRHPNDFVPAEWYAFLHDNSHAMAELDKSAAQHDPSTLDIGINPMYDNLHKEPAYTALLARVGLRLPPSHPGNSLRASLK